MINLVFSTQSITFFVHFFTFTGIKTVAISGIDSCSQTTKLCSFSCLFLPVSAPALASEVERRVKKADLCLGFSVSDFRMQKAAALVSLLVLGFSWTLRGLPAPPEPLHSRQENVDTEKVGEKYPSLGQT